MILQIDAGNSRLKWRLRAGEEIVDRGVVSAGGVFDVAGLPRPIERVVVSTVRSDARRVELANQLRTSLGVSPEFHDTQAHQCGLRCGYARPGDMGADRWHALVGAAAHQHPPLVVVDAGSAITVDYLDAAYRHRGGYILPGERLHLNALFGETDRVRFQGGAGHSGRPGRSTNDCVMGGLHWLREALADRLNAESFGAVLVTGGDAEALLAAGLQARWYPELVLDGLERVDIGWEPDI
ncbi:pantothenate kinase [Tamilnaduibacter salinus]|uniref:Type III pantothenate kinase n=1 Tax=Tamilnaduibacter salinus TaxID=1484056 RepID=A0A2A2HZD7_9GAMM|nr:type III pantothenate kinase [Tamilnaduibacter salinus]PAV24662.1 type III pantothenate kinase [Tamilnaduibacter salinus]PVY70259.1 pantothenate kinase [Tamilnaduibacter salinus]